MESGTINRAVYRWAVLADGRRDRQRLERPAACMSTAAAAARAITRAPWVQGGVLDTDRALAGLREGEREPQQFGADCNDVLSAETMSMVKERLIEQLGEPPVWTMGWGGSGGAIQQNDDRPELPRAARRDRPQRDVPGRTASAEPADCRLLNRYFAASVTSLVWTPRSGGRSMGYSNLEHVSRVGRRVRERRSWPSLGCELDRAGEPDRYNAVTNPTGARCTTWDSMVNIYGRDPATGFARRTLDNVGVQYGLEAFRTGAITMDRFLDLNEKIGGYDNDGNLRAARAVADPEALATAYRTGRVNQAAGGAARRADPRSALVLGQRRSTSTRTSTRSSCASGCARCSARRRTR